MGFIKKRLEVKKNVEELLKKDLPLCSLDKIIYFPINNFYLAYQGIPSVDRCGVEPKLRFPFHS